MQDTKSNPYSKLEIETERSIIGKNIFPTISRITIALENVLSPAYVGNIMSILYDMGVQFPEIQASEKKISLKDKYLQLLKGAEFHEEEKPYTHISTNTREFLREISRDKPKIKIFLEQAKKYTETQKNLNKQILLKTKELKIEENEENQQKIQKTISLLINECKIIPIPLLREELQWDMLTGVNKNYKEFRDMFLGLEDDIPLRKEEGWMSDVYINFLEHEMIRSKTLLHLENVRENFDYIKTLRDDVLVYHDTMGNVVNKEFILGIKEDIDQAKNIEKISNITKKYKQMKKVVLLILQHPISFSNEHGNRTLNTEQLKKVETYSQIINIAKKTKTIIEQRKEQQKKSLEEKKNKAGFGKKIMGMIGK